MDKPPTVADPLKVLWCARIDAACDRWHLEHSAVPMLTALANETGDPLIRRALERTTKAHEWLDETRESLAAAIKLLERFSGYDESERRSDLGDDVAGYSVVRNNGRDNAVQRQQESDPAPGEQTPSAD